MEGHRVTERVMEFDHVAAVRNIGKLLRSARSAARQRKRNHAETVAAVANAPIDRRTHLLILPEIKSAGIDEYGASFRCGPGLFVGRFATIFAEFVRTQNAANNEQRKVDEGISHRRLQHWMVMSQSDSLDLTQCDDDRNLFAGFLTIVLFYYGTQLYFSRLRYSP
jgi:hypothetical protein